MGWNQASGTCASRHGALANHATQELWEDSVDITGKVVVRTVKYYFIASLQ